VTAIAKGARRPKSPFEAALDVLAVIRIVFHHKSSEAMDLLTEAKLERRFRNRAGGLDSLYAAYYVVELLRTMTEDGDPHPELFDLTVQTIAEIEGDSELGKFRYQNVTNEVTNDATKDVTKDLTKDAGTSELPAGRLIKELNLCLLRFEVGLLTILGHFPILTKCAECGRARTTQNRVQFGLNAGGVLCQKCRAGQSNIIGVSHEGIELLLDLSGDGQKKILRVRESGWAVKQRLEIAGALVVEVRKLMNKYLSHLLGFEPRLHKFLKNLERSG
jgi:DNA repair protein RecO (recombination protein O)